MTIVKLPGAFDTFEAAEEVAHINRTNDGSWYYRVEQDLGYWYIEVYDEEKNHLGRLGEMSGEFYL